MRTGRVSAKTMSRRMATWRSASCLTAWDDSVHFVYVTPWRWASKKGIAGNIESGLNLGWKYNWNIDQNSTRDLQYIPIRQQRWWPGLGQNWQTLGADHLLGYNEPDHTD